MIGAIMDGELRFDASARIISSVNLISAWEKVIIGTRKEPSVLYLAKDS
jgi:hypothetical protein